MDSVDVTIIINKKIVATIHGLMPIEGEAIEKTIINEIESWVK